VVWDQDVFKTDPARLVSVKAERTMVGGQWMHES
jgi:predicted amidohydrolase YtcJ